MVWVAIFYIYVHSVWSNIVFIRCLIQVIFEYGFTWLHFCFWYMDIFIKLIAIVSLFDVKTMRIGLCQWVFKLCLILIGHWSFQLCIRNSISDIMVIGLYRFHYEHAICCWIWKVVCGKFILLSSVGNLERFNSWRIVLSASFFASLLVIMLLFSLKWKFGRWHMKIWKVPICCGDLIWRNCFLHCISVWFLFGLLLQCIVEVKASLQKWLEQHHIWRHIYWILIWHHCLVGGSAEFFSTTCQIVVLMAWSI